LNQAIDGHLGHHNRAKSDLNDKCGDRENKHSDELGVVQTADVVVDPSTVVVETENAPVAERAVLGALENVREAHIAVVLA